MPGGRDFLRQRNIDLLSAEKKANLAKLGALLSAVSYNIDEIDVILKQVREIQRRRKKRKTGQWSTPLRLSKECLELLVTAQYILLPQKLSEDIRSANSLIGITNGNLDMWWEVGEEVEERLIGYLPAFKKSLVKLLKEMNKVRVDYANDNYIEPETPHILLSSPKHQKYLQITK